MTYTGKTFIDFVVTGKVTRNLFCEEKDRIIFLDKPTFSNVKQLEKFSGIIFHDTLYPTAHETLLVKDSYIPVIHDVQQDLIFQEGDVVTLLSVDGTGIISKGEEKIKKKHTKFSKNKYYALTSTISGMKYYKEMHAKMVATRGEFMLLPLLEEHPLEMLKNSQSREKVRDGLEKILMFASENFETAVYRLSDFCSDSLQHLKKFNDYEQIESNPIVGNRGAYRLLHSHLPLLQFELNMINALKQKNIEILIPFVRTIDEAVSITKYIKKIVKRKVRIGCMIEIPQILQFPEQLSGLFDFFVVGTKDLSQLLSGVDRQFLSISSDTEWFITYLLDVLFLSKLNPTKEVYITSRNIHGNLSKKYTKNLFCLDD